MNPRWLIPAVLLLSGLAACADAATPTRALPDQTAITVVPESQPTASEMPNPTSSSSRGLLPSPPLLPSPTPSETPSPAFSPSSTLLPNPTLRRPPATGFIQAPDRDLFRLAAELAPVGPDEIPRVANPNPVSYAEGREDTFWLVDMPGLKMYQSRFVLRLVTPHAYWYFEADQAVSPAALERSAAAFEAEIYPLVTAAFGKEWSPGVDNDPHLNILNARLRGVGGYYSSADSYPKGVLPFSNEREAIYINTAGIPVGSTGYLEVLAHELQHAAHWNADPSEDTWINEGLSELAAAVAGFGESTMYSFLRAGPTSLVHWPLLPFGSGPSYGAAALFMQYLAEHYGDPNDMRPLLREPADGIAGIDAYLRASGHEDTFRDLFRDWAVANLIDEGRGVYGYSDLDVEVRVPTAIDRFTEFSSEIPQYSVEYIELDSFEGPLRLRFRAPTETSLLPVEVDSHGCWWSNSGDSINSTLTRAVDLVGLARATLDYQVWYSLEEEWDYAYLEVSVDGGQTWDILETPHSTPENPIGNSFGMGYTGDSDGWINESIDLTAYAGHEVLLRFQYVTDDAISGAGLCLRRVSIPEAGLLDVAGGWRADGFVLTDNRVKQDYIVQVIQVAEGNRVTVMPLDDANSGEAVIPAPQDLARLVVAVAALAPKTRQMAPYVLSVEPAS